MNHNQDSHKKQSIYDYDDRIKRTYNLIQRDLSKENCELIKRYDKEMITQGLGKAARHKNLQIALNLSRLLGKDWMGTSKDDVENLVIKIIELYSDKNGQETHTSYDHKKILKIFFRWLKLGSREQKQVGDPPETKNIRIKKVKDKISREDLLTESDLIRFRLLLEVIAKFFVYKIVKTLASHDLVLFQKQVGNGLHPHHNGK